MVFTSVAFLLTGINLTGNVNRLQSRPVELCSNDRAAVSLSRKGSALQRHAATAVRGSVRLSLRMTSPSPGDFASSPDHMA